VAGQGGLANEVRARLELVETLPKVAAPKPDLLDELWFRKPVRQHLREFGALLAAVLLTIAAFKLYRGRANGVVLSFALPAMLLAFLGYYAPRVLHPIWKTWMAFAEKLGLVMTTIILLIGWTIVMLPVAFCLRLLRIKVMNTEFKRSVTSYWEDRDAKLDNFKLLERQF
jgi:cytochrome bd-type quinol oxidase subunit 2